MFSSLKQLIQARPRPFIRFQKVLGIHDEWSSFKSAIRPHKFKLLFLTAFAAYPLYKPHLEYYYLASKMRFLGQLENGQPIPSVVEAFAKQIVYDVLRDPQMKREGGVFIEELSKRQVVIDAIVNLLVRSAEDPHFVKEAKVFAKFLTHEVLHDPRLEQDALELVVTYLRDPEMKAEVLGLVKWMMQQETTRKELVDLARDSFQQPKLQNSVRDLMMMALYEVLMDKETVNKLKVVSSSVMESEVGRLKDKGNVRSILDLVVDKLVRGETKTEEKDFGKKVEKESGPITTIESFIQEQEKKLAEEKKKSGLSGIFPNNFNFNFTK